MAGLVRDSWAVECAVTTNNPWLVWQLVDSAFPSGGFAHSGGLEAAYQAGLVRNSQRLTEFIETQLAAAARGAGPFVLNAHRAAPQMQEVDSACDVFLSNHVANRGSRAQGRALLAAASRVFGNAELTRLGEAVRASRSPGHFAPVLGAVTALLGVDEAEVCRLLMFLTVRTLVSSAVRLGIVGPMEGQTIQHRAAGAAERWAKVAERSGDGGAVQVSPMVELLQASQDRLYSRLFQS
jgi:urease accessory protein